MSFFFFSIKDFRPPPDCSIPYFVPFSPRRALFFSFWGGSSAVECWSMESLFDLIYLPPFLPPLLSSVSAGAADTSSSWLHAGFSPGG